MFITDAHREDINTLDAVKNLDPLRSLRNLQGW